MDDLPDIDMLFKNVHLCPYSDNIIVWDGSPQKQQCKCKQENTK